MPQRLNGKQAWETMPVLSFIAFQRILQNRNDFLTKISGLQDLAIARILQGEIDNALTGSVQVREEMLIVRRRQAQRAAKLVDEVVKHAQMTAQRDRIDRVAVHEFALRSIGIWIHVIIQRRDRLCGHIDIRDLVHTVMREMLRMRGALAQQIHIVVFHDHEIWVDMIWLLPFGDQLLAQVIMQISKGNGLALLYGREQCLDVLEQRRAVDLAAVFQMYAFMKLFFEAAALGGQQLADQRF